MGWPQPQSPLLSLMFEREDKGLSTMASKFGMLHVDYHMHAPIILAPIIPEQPLSAVRFCLCKADHPESLARV